MNKTRLLKKKNNTVSPTSSFISAETLLSLLNCCLHTVAFFNSSCASPGSHHQRTQTPQYAVADDQPASCPKSSAVPASIAAPGGSSTDLWKLQSESNYLPGVVSHYNCRPYCHAQPPTGFSPVCPASSHPSLQPRCLSITTVLPRCAQLPKTGLNSTGAPPVLTIAPGDPIYIFQHFCNSWRCLPACHQRSNKYPCSPANLSAEFLVSLVLIFFFLQVFPAKSSLS